MIPRAPRCRCLPAAVLCALLLPGAAPATAAPGSSNGSEAPPERKKGEVKLVLQATPRHGFEPLDVTLYARLEEVPSGETMFCHAGVEWIGETRSGRVMRSTEDARCIHPDDVARVDHSYSKDVYIDEPSVYRYYVVLHLKDGSDVRSNTVEVRVIASH